MNRFFAFIIIFILLQSFVAYLSQNLKPNPTSSSGEPQNQTASDSGIQQFCSAPLPQIQDQKTVRFQSVDIIIDAQEHQLAAYQIKITDPNSQIQIVGVEGSLTQKAYNHPPFYDPKAIQNNQIILAAIASDQENLPQGKVKIATLHLQIQGANQPQLNTKIIALANQNQQKFSGKLKLAFRKG